MDRLFAFARHVVVRRAAPSSSVTAAAGAAAATAVASASATASCAHAATGSNRRMKVVFLPDSPGENPRYLFPTLREAFPTAAFVFPTTANEAATELRDADAAMGQLRPEVLAASGGAPRLKLLQSPQAAPPPGFYYDELTRHPCRVSNMRGTFNDQLPLHVLTMMLTLNRNFHIYRDQQAARVYQQVPDNAALDSSSTVVVVGVGAAGREVARLCKQVFGTRVIGIDSGRAHLGDWLDSLHDQEELDSVLGQADVVVVTIPHTPETDRLFDANKFKLMRPHALFINIGRGGTVVLSDLDAALRAGNLGGAGLDVYEIEPLPKDHPLWDAPNTMLTPHSGVTQIQGGAGSSVVPSGSSPGQRTKFQERCIEIVRHNLQQIEINSNDFRNLVDKDKWY